ncbi:L-threonylcarbamoyladenylate synthase [Salarchaeum japonicum]|uniref:L-threonylcarbamoyladenylate synthase n=1 Tax=Salarchaeum japonicum TaxID=555573 RepID=A0AAV3SZS7_9EURY|nr:L-threonylcarbamoyladenylate synthase [Salarchaeum japonicum]
MSLADATAAVADGGLVVYPTDTVYGLAGDALDSEAIERVFAAKGRDRSKPLSMGVGSVDAALDYVDASEREEAFMREFLPGAVTVVCEKRDRVPDALTGGKPKVGVRVPDHELALDFLDAAGPVTATSANRSGRSNARRVTDLDPEIRDAARVVLDGGETRGGESTVVDAAAGVIHRRGRDADRIEAWLEERA